MYSDGDSIALMIIWTFYAIYCFYRIVFNYSIYPEKAKAVFAKDCNPSHPETIRYKYLISIFLDSWSTNFDMKKSVIFFNLITRQKNKMVSFSFTSEEIVHKRTLLLLHRKKALRPLTNIRVIHDCQESKARIHLSAIRVHDMKFGHIYYYSIDRNIYCQTMAIASIHSTSPVTLDFFSKTLLYPYYFQNEDTFSLQRLVGKIGTNYETNGVILMPELNGWEEMTFTLFLVISEVYFDVFFAIILKESLIQWSDINILCLAAFLSSTVSFNSTNISALFYRRVIKTNYNIECSPQLRETDKDSLLWTLYKNLYLTTLVSISIFVSVFVPHYTSRSMTSVIPVRKYLFDWFNTMRPFESEPMNETVFLVIFWAFTHLILSLIVWLFISAFIKYLYLRLCAVPKYIHYESIAPNTEDVTSGSDDSSEVFKKTVPTTVPKDKPVDRDPSKLQLGTKRLETELRSDRHNKKLRTGSVIRTPTKNPLGFVDPEKYRLGTDSKPKTNTNNETKN